MLIEHVGDFAYRRTASDLREVDDIAKQHGYQLLSRTQRRFTSLHDPGNQAFRQVCAKPPEGRSRPVQAVACIVYLADPG